MVPAGWGTEGPPSHPLFQSALVQSHGGNGAGGDAARLLPEPQAEPREPLRHPPPPSLTASVRRGS